jgi:hypothetical protein
MKKYEENKLRSIAINNIEEVNKKLLRIYVASSWNNEYYEPVIRRLKHIQHTSPISIDFYDFRNPEQKTAFSWQQIDENWECWTQEEQIKAMTHPLAEAGFKSDFDAMKWANICILVLPAGRSACAEAGWMKGQGKKVVVFSPVSERPDLMFKIFDGIFNIWDNLWCYLKNI